ncbi:MAG: DUF4446 family protein [Chloroflexota bacterium]
MNSLQPFFHDHAALAWVVLAVALLLTILWMARLGDRVKRSERRLTDLLYGVSGDNISNMLVEYLGTVRNVNDSMTKVKHEHDAIVELLPGMIRHLGLVRFSPFHDTGGDQSFALALLDGQRNGVVITALHSRSDSRLYAKPIDAGSSPYALTPEEEQAMAKALGRDLVDVG